MLLRVIGSLFGEDLDDESLDDESLDDESPPTASETEKQGAGTHMKTKEDLQGTVQMRRHCLSVTVARTRCSHQYLSIADPFPPVGFVDAHVVLVPIGDVMKDSCVKEAWEHREEFGKQNAKNRGTLQVDSLETTSKKNGSWANTCLGFITSCVAGAPTHQEQSCEPRHSEPSVESTCRRRSGRDQRLCEHQRVAGHWIVSSR